MSQERSARLTLRPCWTLCSSCWSSSLLLLRLSKPLVSK
jgi:hypothetical protein